MPRHGGKHVGGPLEMGSEQKPGWLEHSERDVWEMRLWERRRPARRQCELFEGLEDLT